MTLSRSRVRQAWRWFLGFALMAAVAVTVLLAGLELGLPAIPVVIVAILIARCVERLTVRGSA